MGALSLGLRLCASSGQVPEVPGPGLVVAITGLTGGEARPGAHASLGYAVTPDVPVSSIRWGTASADATYGSGESPSDYGAGEGGLLWLTVSAGGDTATAVAAIRHAAPAAAGDLPDVAIVIGNAGTIATAGDFTFAGLRRFTLSAGPAGLDIDAATGQISTSGVTLKGDFGVVVRLEDATDPGRFAESGFSLSVEDFALTGTTDGEIEINGATGQVTITVTSPAIYAARDAGAGPGTFMLNVADLATGPVNLVPPAIIDDGSPATGETLSLVPGLWVYDADAGGLEPPAYQWQANGADITGATAVDYVVGSGDAGRSIRVRESLADARGARVATSAAVALPGGAALLDDGFTTNTTASYAPSSGWEIVGGQARMVGLSGAINAIFPSPNPPLGADHFVRGRLGNLGAGTSALRLRAKMDPIWSGSSFANVTAIVRADGQLILHVSGTDVASFAVPGGFQVGDTIELRITGGGALATLLLNGGVPIAGFQGVNVASLPASSRVAFGLQGSWHLDRFEAGNI